MHIGTSSAEALSAPALPSAPQYLSNQDAMRRLGVCDQTMRNWRNAGVGPRYVRFGGRIRYKLDDIVAFEQNSTFASRVDEKTSLANAA